MCNFFSCISDGHGSIRYFGAKEITEIEEQGNPKNYEFDSHSSICNYFEINEDKWNKYEYNPFTKKFEVDTLNNKNDSAHVEKQVRNLDFTDIFETGLFGIDLRYLESLDGIEFPEKCTYINLCRCTELNNVKFPKEITGYFDLSSLKKLDNVILPEKCEYINLNSIESKDYEIPEKHGTIYFKDKKIG